MSRVAKVIVAAENKTGSGIKAAAQTINGFGRDVQKVGNIISKAFVVTAVAGFAKKLASVASEMEGAWATQERALLGFEAAMRGAASISSSGVASLKEFSVTMASLVGVDDQVILSLETLLATSGRTEDQIRMIINAAADMSAATGKDLKTSVEQLNKTFGGTAGELGEILPAMKGLTKEQLLAGDAVELVAGQYKGMAEALSGTAQVSIDNYKNTVGDLQEELGGLISLGLSPLREWLTVIVRQWGEAAGAARNYASAQAKVKGGVAYEAMSEAELVELNKKVQEKIGAAKIGLEVTTEGTGAYKRFEKQLEELYSDQAKIVSALRSFSVDRAYSDYAPGAAPAIPSATRTSSSTTSESGDADSDAMAERLALKLGLYTGASDRVRGGSGGVAADDEMVSRGGGSMLFGGELAGLADAFGPVIEMVGGFAGSLGNLQAILNPIQTIMQGMFDVLGPLLEDLLAPISGMLQIFGQIIAQTLIPVINILTPVIEGLAKMMVWFANKIMIPVGNFIIGIWNGIVDAINAALGWAGVSIARASLINPVALSDAKAAGQSTSTYGTTSSSGASYAGAQSITFNFYNQGNVVGSGGLEELALLIDSILQRNARYA